MEDKARKLVLVLEGLALLTAVILILVDYKLKNDLVALYKDMEASLKRGEEFFLKDSRASSDTGSVHTGSLVDHAPTLEAPASTSASTASPNGFAKSSRRASAQRSRGNGNTSVSGSDNPVGS